MTHMDGCVLVRATCVSECDVSDLFTVHEGSCAHAQGVGLERQVRLKHCVEALGGPEEIVVVIPDHAGAARHRGVQVLAVEGGVRGLATLEAEEAICGRRRPSLLGP